MNNKLLHSHPTTLFLIGLLQKQITKVMRIMFVVVALQLLVSNCIGQLSLTTGSAVTINFDGMGTATTVPSGFKINSGAATAYSASGTTTTQSASSFSSSSAGGSYNLGNPASTSDRALGFLGSGSYAPGTIYFAVTNNTGATLSGFTISWNYEKYRSGSRAWSWAFTTTATAGGGSGFADPVSGAGNLTYAADANNTTTYSPPTTTGVSFTISGLSLANTSSYYFRWILTGSGGTSNGQALGIDDFVITPVFASCTGTPAAGTASAATTNICTTGSSVLSVTGGTSGAGISYQWQSSSDSSTWTDISGATATGYTATTITSLTYFRRKTICTPSSSSSFSNGAKVTVTSITSSPTNSTIAATTGTSFTVSATSPASYQWQRSTTGTGGTFVNITSGTFDAVGTYSGYTTTSTATTNTLTLSSVPTAWNGYAYQCVVTNTCGSVTSAPALLTVTSSGCSGTPAPGTATPVTANFCTNGSTTINLSAYTVGSDVTYQWQSSSDTVTWTNITGATNAAYVTPTLTATTYYHCVTTCGGSSLTNTSNIATVTITRVVLGPTSVLISPTSGATFTNIASGATSYQWQRSTTGTGGTFVNITSGTMDATGAYSGYTTTGGSDTNTLTLAGVPSGWNNYAYRCVVTNTCGNIISGGATLNVQCAGTPATGTATAGTSSFCTSGSTTITLTGYSLGAGTTFQWEASSDSVTWTPVSGATNTTYTTPTITSTTYYHCITSCSYSSSSNTSNIARVMINPLPTLAVTPAGGDVCSGTSGLSMTASGASTYSWAPSASLSAATGATVSATPTVNTTYTITGTSAAGCVRTTTVTATYRVSPAAVTLSPASITMCHGATPQRIVVSGGNEGPTTVSSGSISVTVNGGANAISTHSITVAGIPAGATITGASVNLTASMPWQDDYVVNLVSPDGHVLNLIDQKGVHSSSTSSFSNTTLSSSSSSAIPSATTIPASTTYAADAINGVGGSPYIANVTNWNSLVGTPNGTWTIVFYQSTTFSNASGTLSNWSLTLNYNYRSVTWSPATRLFTNTGGTVAYSGAAADTIYAAADTAASTIVYTATSANGGCIASQSDTVTVVNSPVIAGTFTLSPATICPGSTDTLTFSGTTSGTGAGSFVSYNWAGPGGYSGTSSTPITTFVPSSSAMSGTYSVSATYSFPGCASTTDTSTTRLNVASPTAYNVTGGYGCAASGVTIGLSNTETTVSYQLYRGATPVGSSVSGTGAAYTFGTFTTPGTYTVFADNGSCSQFMNDSAVVYDTLIQYNVMGGSTASGAGCASVGLVIGLSNSQYGVSYQLYNGASPVGSPVTGTGAAISFNGGSAITTAGTYTVIATIGSCTKTMLGSSIIYSSLSAYSVTGGTGCSSPGLAIGLSNSNTGVSYQLYLNSVVTGSPITGTGSAISFGTLTTLGTYTVLAAVGGGCTLAMTGSALVYGSPSFTVSPATTAICAAPGRLLTVTPSATPLTILNESFDGTISSDGWTTDFTTIAWAQTTGSSYSWSTSSLTSSGKFYILNDGVSSFTSSHLVSPSFSLVGLASASLTFNSFFDYNGAGETAGADISTNGGSTWTSIFAASNNWSTGRAYTMISTTVSLNAYVGNANVKIRFRYDKSTAGTSYIFAVDNAVVTGTPPTASYSWAPAAGLSVATGLTATAIPTVSTVYTVSVLGCTAGTASVTVDALPTAGSVSVSSTNICTGSGATLVLSEAGTPTGPSSATLASYSWTGPNSYVSSAAATSVSNATLTPSSPAASGIYSLTVTYNEPGCTSVPVTSPSVTVNYLPAITIGANPSTCQPVSSANISYSSPVGSPTTYSIAWDTTSISAGFTDVVSSSLGAVIPLVIPTGAAGTFGGSISVSNSTCTSATTYPFTLTVYAHPDAAITSAPTTVCAGYSGNIIISGTSGAQISYSIDGGTTHTATLTGGTYTLSTGAITTSHTYRLIDAHNPVCSTTIDSSLTLNPIQMQWVGGTTGSESNWNTAGNWSCGFIPGTTDDVIIPSGTTYTPVVAASDNAYARKLTIGSGANVSVNVNGVLNVGSTFNNSGSVTGAGTLTMNGSSAQGVNGIGSVDNFDVNNSAGVSVNSGSQLIIKSVLSVTTGTLATGDSVVLYSDSTATARVAPLPSSGSVISGNVKVLQYVEGGRRAYRFWSHPFSNSIGLSQVQNYIDVTGIGGSANGFTPTASNSPSAYRYNPLMGNSSLAADPGWKAFTSTSTTADSNRIHPYQGIRLFFRGAKGAGLDYIPYTPAAVTVAQWGILNQGTQTVTLSKGSSNPYEEYNMVGNPYASPTDIGTVVYNAYVAGNVVGPSFFVWNSTLGTAGQFQAQFMSTVTPIPYYIQANNSFQVRAASDGTTLTFTESNKGAATTANLFKAQSGYTSLKIYDAGYHPYDMLYIQFNDEATEGNDRGLDAIKPFGGADLNFYSIAKDNTMMIIDARPYDEEKTIPLGISAKYQQDYILKTEGLAVPDGKDLYLHDKLLKQYVKLQAGTEYRFSITEDVSTQGNSRFELAMKQSGTSLTSKIGLKATIIPNPATDEINISFTTGENNNVAIRMLDISGACVYNNALGVLSNGDVKVNISNLASGIYMVELTSGNQKVVQRLVKE